MSLRQTPAVRTLVPLVGPLLLGLAVAVDPDALGAFEHDFDEGGNVMKALLVADGHPLYGEVWSDQPPLLTHALAIAFRVFGADVVIARVVVAVIVALGLVSASRVVGRHRGASAAAAVPVFLLAAPSVLRLSTSVMIGLPALALGLIGLDLLEVARLHGSSRRAFFGACAAGVVVGAGIGVKLFVLPLAAVLTLLLVFEWLIDGRSRRRAGLVVGWALGGGVAGAAVLWLVGLDHVHLLRETHEAARGTALGLPWSDVVAPLAPLVVLAVLAAARALRRREPVLIAIALWLVVDVAALLWHTPRWYHHAVLVSVPAALLAATLLPLPGAGRVRLVAAVATGALSLGALTAGSRAPAPSTPVAAPDVVTTLATHQVGQMLTDRPMIAFRAGARVPPHFAVVSAKRRTVDDLEGLFRFYAAHDAPQALWLGRFKFLALESELPRLGYAQVPASAGHLWLYRATSSALPPAAAATPLPARADPPR